ncbi:MAG: hypothetical protein QOH36_44 [Actinomycetota bacterium]|nr:hypothetical protein [Actinomycetota bacterium]
MTLANTEVEKESGLPLRRYIEHLPSERVAKIAHGATLVLIPILILVVGRNQWFAGNDWNFITQRTQGGMRTLFEAYADQWVTGTVVLFRATFAVVGADTYWPYLVPVVALHAIGGHFLWRIMRQVGINVWLSTMLVALFLVSGGGAEALFEGPNTSNTGSLALGLALILLVNRAEPDRRRDVLAAVVAILALMFHGNSVAYVIVAALVVLYRRGWKSALRFSVPPAIVYLGWLAIIGRDSVATAAKHQITPWTILKAPDFAWTALVASVEQSTLFTGAGAVILIALAGYLLYNGRLASTPAAPIFAMAIGAVILLLLTAPPRYESFIDEGRFVKSRYVQVGWVLLLPAVGLAVQALGRWFTPRLRVLALLGVIAAVGMQQVSALVDQAEGQEAAEQELKGIVRAASFAVANGPYLPNASVDVVSGSGLRARDLATLIRNRDLTPPTAISPAELAVAEKIVQIRFTAESSPDLRDGARPRLLAVRNATVGIDGRGCSILQPEPGQSPPEIDLSVTAPTEILVQTSGGGALTVLRPSATAGGPPVLAKATEVTPGAIFVELATVQGSTGLRLPPGESVVCGLGGQAP